MGLAVVSSGQRLHGKEYSIASKPFEITDKFVNMWLVVDENTRFDVALLARGSEVGGGHKCRATVNDDTFCVQARLLVGLGGK